MGRRADSIIYSELPLNEVTHGEDKRLRNKDEAANVSPCSCQQTRNAADQSFWVYGSESIEVVVAPRAASPPPVIPQATPTLRPTLKPWSALIDRMIEGDAARPKRLRTSAMEVFRTLRDKHAYTGCYNSVQEYIYAVINPERPKASRLRESQNARRGRDTVAPQEIARTTGVIFHPTKAPECELESVPSPDQTLSLVPRATAPMLYRNSLRLQKEREARRSGIRLDA